MYKYVNTGIAIKTKFHGNTDLMLYPLNDTISFWYWGTQHDDVPVYKANDDSLWVEFEDAGETCWHQLKRNSRDELIPSNITALNLEDWNTWNNKQSGNDWWK